MTDANRVSYIYKQESSYASTQTGNWYELRSTSDTLRQETNNTNSAELRSDRQIAAFVRTAINASGDTNHELSLDSFDRLWQAVLMNTTAWGDQTQTAIGPDTDVTFVSRVEDTSPATLTSVSSPYGAINDGDWVLVEGAASAKNNGVRRVIEATAGTLHLSGEGQLDASPGESVTVTVLDRMNDNAPNDTDNLSFAFQKTFNDYVGADGNLVGAYFGMMPEGVSLTAAREQIITFSMNWFGQKETSAGVAASAQVTTTTDPLNTIDNIDKIVIGDLDQTAVELNFQMNNNLRTQLELGQEFIPDLGMGTIGVTGKVQAYYEGDTGSGVLQYDLTEYDRYLNGDFSSFAIVFTDGTDYLVFDFPRIKYSAGQRVAQGINQDTILDLDFTAYKMGTTDITGGRTAVSNPHTFTIHRYVAP